jgi:small subunit ribosomal protein S21
MGLSLPDWGRFDLPRTDSARSQSADIVRCYGQPREGGESCVAEVRLSDGESLESALRRFKRKVQQEDIIKEVKRHAFYMPPGEKRRVKSALARKRNRKKYRRSFD